MRLHHHSLPARTRSRLVQQCPRPSPVRVPQRPSCSTTYPSPTSTAIRWIWSCSRSPAPRGCWARVRAVGWRRRHRRNESWNGPIEQPCIDQREQPSSNAGPPAAADHPHQPGRRRRDRFEAVLVVDPDAHGAPRPRPRAGWVDSVIVNRDRPAGRNRNVPAVVARTGPGGLTRAATMCGAHEGHAATSANADQASAAGTGTRNLRSTSTSACACLMRVPSAPAGSQRPAATA